MRRWKWPTRSLSLKGSTQELSSFARTSRSLAVEVLHLCGDHRAALHASEYAARSMDRGVRLTANQSAAVAALASAVAVGAQGAIDEWLDRCAGHRTVEPRTAEARRAYARGERAAREGRS